MAKRSAGVLLFRRRDKGTEVLLAHPGGPFWAKRDDGAWSIPKGEYDERTEDALTAAKRELREEIGLDLSCEMLDLGCFRQPSGKLVSAWAAEGDFDPRNLESDACRIEWPPRSGRLIEIPEIDRVAWFSIEEARKKLVKGQVAIVQALAQKIGCEVDEGRGP